MSGLVAEGTLRSVIDRTYPLDQTAEAIRDLAEGHARRKVLIALAGERGLAG